ncbi:opioid growth factor receptor-like [Melanotaenia boesemani]|uniref:opioid growth factor receptor-like n=1 Tax=Melanotaenia boesemani TaxID=1250792 RepID=UPI001C044ECB|nr:opioid growth factor receptor-like [Melanotaenia boesemani]
MRTVFCCVRKYAMFALFFSTIYPAFGWLWRRLPILWCFVTRKCPILLKFSRLPLLWRKGGGNEPETSGESNPSVGPYSDDEEESLGEEAGQRGPDPEAPGPDPEARSLWTNFGKDAREHREEPTEEFCCAYDSTWESEDQDPIRTVRRTRHSAGFRNERFRRFENAAKDMQNYRHDYPGQNKKQYQRNPASDRKPNLSFYTGETHSLPDGVFIRDFHKKWHGDYDSLERVHTFIQWLFPLQEPGVNYEASTLTKEEIKEFCENPTAQSNLLKSYKLMLDFYGIELVNETTGDVKRAKNWRERFDNLNSHTHNNLRITRILKCLGTLGYPHYQAPLVHFFLEETLVHRELPKVKESVLNYFVFAVLNKSERKDLIQFAYKHYFPREEFVWCPRRIQKMWSSKRVFNV